VEVIALKSSVSKLVIITLNVLHQIAQLQIAQNLDVIKVLLIRVVQQMYLLHFIQNINVQQQVRFLANKILAIQGDIVR
jgi:hypothetical protein